LRRCEVTLRSGHVATFDPATCEVIPDQPAGAKGGYAFAPQWAVEASAGLGGATRDEYIERLEDFGYQSWTLVRPRLAVAALRSLTPNLDAIAEAGYLGIDEWHRSGEAGGITTGWSTTTIGGGIRGRLSAFGGGLVPYAQLGAGLAVTSSFLRNPGSGENDRAIDLGYQLGGAAGLQFNPWTHVGLSVQMSFVIAPSLKNLLGDVHDTGGLFLSLSGRVVP
jgi:hypothetical protein